MARSGDDLRHRLERGGTVLLPGVWDPLSCRLAGEAGFESVFLSGFGVAATLLGLPDIGYLTQGEMAEVARRVCTANPDTIVVVDGDTGYGNALNTIRTVELWEAAGAAGIFLEDQVWPKRCGHMGGKQVVARDDWLAKLRAALQHRDRLFVTARTDARGAVGLEEAIERVRMAADLGVDAVFVEAPESEDELRRIGDSVPGVIQVANMVERGATPLATPSELAALGFQLIVSPVTGLLAMVRALRDTFDVLCEAGTLRDELDRLEAFDAFTSLVGLDDHRRRERQASVPAEAPHPRRLPRP